MILIGSEDSLRSPRVILYLPSLSWYNGCESVCRPPPPPAAAFLAQRVGKVWSCCLLSGVCLCCRDDKPSAVVISTEDEHLCILSLAPYTTRWTTDSRLIPCFLARPFVQRKPPVLRRPEAASHHSLATVAPSGGAGENGAATPVTATTTTHYTIITIITATTNATLMP